MHQVMARRLHSQLGLWSTHNRHNTTRSAMGMDQSRYLAALFGKYGITTNHMKISVTWNQKERPPTRVVTVRHGHVQFQRFSLQAGMTVWRTWQHLNPRYDYLWWLWMVMVFPGDSRDKKNTKREFFRPNIRPTEFLQILAHCIVAMVGPPSW